MSYFFYQIEDDYVGSERTSYWLHMIIALLCTPIYIISNKFGLFMMPYVFFITLRPRSCYLLPLIIHFAYGIQCRYAFCLACFLYVVFHYNDIVKLRLQAMFVLYLLIMPFFIWFTVTKFKDFQNYVSMSGNVAGINTYFLFSGIFWGCIAIKKLGRTFTNHFALWNVAIFALISVADYEGSRFFTRQIFYAAPLLSALLVGSLWSKDRTKKKMFFYSIIGVLLYLLDFFGILKYKVTFTILGLMILSAIYVYCGRCKNRFLLFCFNPKLLVLTSFVVVMISAGLVLKYRGLHEGEGEYGELSNTSVSSIWTKLQMKAIDDRATLWALSIERIKEIWQTNPVFIDTVGRFTLNTDLLDAGLKSQEVTIDIQSHNVMLELLRSFGFYGGLGLYILYLWIFISPRNMKILKMVKDPTVLTICAVCVSQGVVCGHAGQYVIQTELGPTNFALLGACWRYLVMKGIR